MQQTDPSLAAPPAVIVIFGAAGDLTKRKLIPALFNLASQQLLSEHIAMVGIDRVEMDSVAYRQTLSEEIASFVGTGFDQALWEANIGKAYYMPGDFRDAQSYARLKTFLDEVDREQGTPGNYLFYLATPPSFFGVIATELGKAGLAQESEGRWRRLIIEKPFGRDLESARALNTTLHESFAEHQIYRIDHYLGKETVQNIMAYRFGNGTVEPIWNHRYIDHVQITVAESLGVGDRASYYEEAGALRDMIANHLLAVLSVVAMEPPNSFEADVIRDEQIKVLKAIQPFDAEQVLSDTVRGQYGEGVLGNGDHVHAYRDEPDIADDSATETYVAMKLMIDSWRWAGVPFYLRTGKRMPGRYSEIVIQYRHAPNMMFRGALERRRDIGPNQLILRIQPNEGISMEFNAKVPGTAFNVSRVCMDFDYDDYFDESTIASGYETLIYDCLCGDATLFKRADNIEVCWELVQPVLDVWHALPPRSFPNYPACSWGPEEADELLARDGHHWRVVPGCSR
ncbi:MAG TPA: glucose-6-phosphate dehydrogenase [Gammaproteobacteria bacterium]|nr:glucose-6-phosphate dehydrogenase [Gammaproteobacteria bacterium]